MEIGYAYQEDGCTKIVLDKQRVDIGGTVRHFYLIEICSPKGNCWYGLREKEMARSNTSGITIREYWVGINANSLSDISAAYSKLAVQCETEQ